MQPAAVDRADEPWRRIAAGASGSGPAAAQAGSRRRSRRQSSQAAPAASRPSRDIPSPTPRGENLARPLPAPAPRQIHELPSGVITGLAAQGPPIGSAPGWLVPAAAARRVAQANPPVAVSTLTRRVSGVDDARDCMRGRDLLVCAADRPRIRIYDWLNEASIIERVPWFRGANDGLTVNVFLHVPGRTACFACEQRRALASVPGYAAMLEHAMHVVADRTVNPCTAPVSGLIGSLVALEAVKFLSGVAPLVVLNRKLIFDLQTMQIRFNDGVRDPDCDACGHLDEPAPDPAAPDPAETPMAQAVTS